MTEKYSSSEEQKEAKEYCLFHPLNRPLLHWGKMIVLLLGVEVAVGILSYMLSLWMNTFLVYYIFGNLFCFILAGKQILINTIRIYQHYAPEEIRRKCLCKPTCSEYAILALKKYNLIKGLYKIYIRLFKTCRGIEYNIDYP